ncbi:MAG: hypothetical protein FJ318_02630 [SAR202 cluster bacterium]|nr:hypothetical protein [SAR202 cluster bacterium]
MATTQAVEAPTGRKDPVFSIDPKQIEAKGRQIGVVVGNRLCPGAIARLKKGTSPRGAGFEELRRLARDYCSKDPDFLSPRLPVLEAAFRLLLASPQNQLSLSDILQQLTEIWITASWPRHISQEALERVLRGPNEYGILVADE